MKRVVSAAFALTALAAATLALAQTTSQTEPPASTEQQQTSPATQPSDPSTSRESGKADTQSLMMRDCIKQVQAANPSVPQKDIKEYCDKQVKSQASPRE